MLRELFENMLKTEEFNNWVGLNFVKREDLAEIVDGMNELELRELASKELGDHIAYTVTIGQLTEWYNSFNLGLME